MAYFVLMCRYETTHSLIFENNYLLNSRIQLQK